MNKETIIWGAIALVAIIIITVLATTRSDGAAPAPQETAGETANPGSGSDREVRGTVTSVDTSQVAADGPALVTVRVEDGTEATIAIRSMGINLCPAQAAIADAYRLKAGDRVEARGSVEAESGAIVPCESSAHYLRVVAQ